MWQAAKQWWVMGIATTLLLAPMLGVSQEGIPAEENCRACHGEDGASLNPLVPKLAGQPYTLIEDNLLAFRAGRRSCAPARSDGQPAAALAKTMCTLVANLSDREIAALADFYSKQYFVPAEQSFDPQLAQLGSEVHLNLGCDRCHARGGRETLGMAPILAGQWTPFLRRALIAVRAGTRKGPKMMNQKIHGLEDIEVEALLNYYASRGPNEEPP